MTIRLRGVIVVGMSLLTGRGWHTSEVDYGRNGMHLRNGDAMIKA
jgi:hypothetical protein